MANMTVDKLVKIRKRAIASRTLGKNGIRVKVTVHMGTCGIASGADKIFEQMTRLIKENTSNDVRVISSGCAGLCSREPMITVQVSGNPPVKYAELTQAKVKKIFNDHIIGEKIVTSSLLAVGSEMTC